VWHVHLLCDIRAERHPFYIKCIIVVCVCSIFERYVAMIVKV
jgi:hypothetical protein